MSKTVKELVLERAKLDDAIKAALETEKAAAIKSVRETIDLYKLTAKECGFKLSKPKKQVGKDKPDGRSAPKPPKYRNPKNPNETWTGLGAKDRRPKWVKDYEAAGGKLEDLLIKK